MFKRTFRSPVYFAIGALIGASFGMYLWGLDRQLIQAFYQEEQFLPTRIYSDLIEITPPQKKDYVLNRIQSLGYELRKIEANTPLSGPKMAGLSASSTQDQTQEKENKDHQVVDEPTFLLDLRRIDYPRYLLPEGHPQRVLPASTSFQAKLVFDGEKKDSLLQSLELNEKEVRSIFLEPQLVATLSGRNSSGKTIRTSLEFSEIPANLWKAVIAVEDHEFLEHSGFNPKGIARAILVNLKTRSFAQGGSTITQQLVKNLMARRTKNLFRKVNELFLSLLLEARFEKEKILERYLNEVYLGQVGSYEVHGIAEGAELFFGKAVHELNLGEIALMAGLIRGPGYYSPYGHHERAIQRQHFVLKRMVETGYLAQAEAESAKEQEIRLAPPQRVTTKAPFFSDYVKAQLIETVKDTLSEEQVMLAGFRIYTTLDPYLNELAQETVEAEVLKLEKKIRPPQGRRLEGILAAVEHSTGKVRVLVGGRNYGESTFNRILNMKRQIGSTFKPLVYLSAFLQGRDAEGIPYSPAHPAEDSKWTAVYDQGRGKWSPQNIGRSFSGWTNYREALAKSINVVAARVGFEVGIKNVVKTAQLLGIESQLPEFPSLSLGTAEVRPVELLRVYATIANHGVREEMAVIRAITKNDGTPFKRFLYYPTQVVDPAAADLLTDVLQDVFTMGSAKQARSMGFQREAAGKTGTTSDYRDAWFAGFTPNLTAITWVGLDQAEGEDLKNFRITGSSAALPVWVEFMKKALASEPPLRFSESEFLVPIEADLHSGLEAEGHCPPKQVRVEKFIRGVEPFDKSCREEWPASVSESYSPDSAPEKENLDESA